MKLIAVENLPKIKNPKHRLQKMIEDFVESGCEVAKIDLTEHDYKTPLVGYKCIYVAARNSKRPVKVHYRDGEVYLTKI